jgi:hypothetical protein
MTERRGVTRGVRAAGRAAAMIGGTLLLALTWHVLFFWLMGATEWLLVPWDTTTERPARGTLARSVNDFFEHAPGSCLPAVVVVGGSMALSAAGFVRNREGRAWLPALVAACNATFIVVDYACVYFLIWVVGGRLPPPQTGYDLGYHRTWPGVLVTVLLLGPLLWCQWRAGAQRNESV